MRVLPKMGVAVAVAMGLSACWPVDSDDAGSGSEDGLITIVSPSAEPAVLDPLALTEVFDLFPVPADWPNAAAADEGADSAQPAELPAAGDQANPAPAGTTAAPATTSPPADAPEASDYTTGVHLGSKVPTSQVCAAFVTYRESGGEKVDGAPLADPSLTCVDSAEGDALIKNNLNSNESPHNWTIAGAVLNSTNSVWGFNKLNSLTQISNGSLAGGSMDGYHIYSANPDQALGMACWNIFWWDATTNSQTDAYISCVWG